MGLGFRVLYCSLVPFWCKVSETRESRTEALNPKRLKPNPDEATLGPISSDSAEMSISEDLWTLL